MTMKDSKIYIDIELLHQKFGGASAFGVINDSGQAQETVYAGKVILSMPVTDKKEKAYQILVEEFDVRFIFDDAIPKFEFYPIPQLGVFAIDSLGGCFGSTNTAVDITEENAPVYYINNEFQCYCIAENLIDFIHLLVYRPEWKNGLVKRGCHTTKPSSEGKEYLIDAFHLNSSTAASEDDIEECNVVTIYQSFEEAKKVVPFFDIANIGGII